MGRHNPKKAMWNKDYQMDLQALERHLTLYSCGSLLLVGVLGTIVYFWNEGYASFSHPFWYLLIGLVVVYLYRLTTECFRIAESCTKQVDEHNRRLL